MNREKQKLIRQLELYRPVNEQEERDRSVILRQVLEVPDVFLRENLTAHMTSSAWVVSPDRKRILMAYHNLYASWSWLGGHADGEENLLHVAVREVREESGIVTVRPLSEEIYSLEILTVDGHEKRGRYVPFHLHLNVTWLLEADDSVQTKVKQDENSAVGWFPVDQAVGMSSEPWFRERIYSKLNRKLVKWQSGIIMVPDS